MNSAIWTPHRNSVAVLNRAWSHIRSVPYAVSLRWVFYRLLQDGTYSAKADYSTKFKPLLATARKAFWHGWRPDTLADETREEEPGGNGSPSVPAWFSAVAEMRCRLDHWATQPFYGMLAFEARAMVGQFAFYAPEFSRWPFGGDPSLDFKHRVATRIRQRPQAYGQHTRIWYFGDLDSKGLQIFEAAMRDVREWAGVPFDVTRVGLTQEQAEAFGVEPSIDHPGSYQWEALTDAQARSLIEIAANEIDQDAWAAVDRQEEGVQRRLGEVLRREGLA